MGGKSSSSSSNKTSTTTVTSQVDNRIGVADDGMVATDGSRITIEDISAEVIEAALVEGFDFGEAAITAISDLKGVELDSITAVAEASIENINAAKSNFDNLLKAGTAIAAVFFISKWVLK